MLDVCEGASNRRERRDRRTLFLPVRNGKAWCVVLEAIEELCALCGRFPRGNYPHTSREISTISCSFAFS